MKYATMLVVFTLLVGFAVSAGPNFQLQSNFLQGIINAIISFFNSIFHVAAPASTTTVTTSHITTIRSTTTHTTSIQTTKSTTVSTTSISISTTTTVSPNATIQCQNNSFLRDNESVSCTPVKLTLVDVGPGNTRYEIANAIVDIYYNSALVFQNQSLLQNSTKYYQFNFSDGHLVQVYVTTAIYSLYPVNRYATIKIVYR